MSRAKLTVVRILLREWIRYDRTETQEEKEMTVPLTKEDIKKASKTQQKVFV